MNLTMEDRGSVLVAKPNLERLDVKSVGDWRKTMQPIIDRGGQVVLDLSAIQFVDSMGLGALLSVMRGLSQNKGQLRLATLTPQVDAMFRLVRMHRIFDVYESADKALSDWR